jgi:hypothetical protein
MKNIAQIFFGFLTIIGFFYCVWHMMNSAFPNENKDQVNQLMGVLLTIFTLQMNFFFGSTASSKTKDETIGTIAKSMSPPNNEITSQPATKKDDL